MVYSIDWDSLLEFEKCLSFSGTKTCRLLHISLENKLEKGSLNDLSCPLETLEKRLTERIKNYDFRKDEFANCGICGVSFKNDISYNDCCESFMNAHEMVSSEFEKSYWLSFLNTISQTITTLPCYTEVLFFIKGLPAQIRPAVWKKLFYIGQDDTVAESLRLVFENFQHSYNPEVSRQISKDLHRTFPKIDFFKNEQNIQSLSTVLNVYANYDAELGYCQGLLFLVSILHYYLGGKSVLTFHALVNVMDSEPELHGIFTPNTMPSTLSIWKREFLNILKSVDSELYDHLKDIGVDFQVFLYQWWLSFTLTHAPNLGVVSRIVDIYLIMGWKIGMFKITLGLLILNRPILMSFNEGDEDIIYQHLLNDSKWGLAMKDLCHFFGDILLSWDDNIFAQYTEQLKHENLTDTTDINDKSFRLQSSSHTPLVNFKDMSSKVPNRKLLNALDLRHTASSASSVQSSFSRLSLPKTTKEAESESLYSNYSNTHSDLASLKSTSSASLSGLGDDQLSWQNEQMKSLLKNAYSLLDGSTADSANLKKEISQFI